MPQDKDTQEMGRPSITDKMDTVRAVDAADDLEKTLDDLNAIMENGGVTISGRIYRFISPVEQMAGRQSCELVGKVEEIVDEDFVGRQYGSGKYKIRYKIKRADGTPYPERVTIFSVGKEYDKFIKKEDSPAAPSVQNVRELGAVGPRGDFLSRFMDSLTPDKIGACALAVKTIKEIFAPAPKPEPDWIGLIKAISGTREPAKPAFSDSVVISAIESLKEAKAQPSVIEQIRDLRRIKDELTGDKDNEEKDGEDMNLYLKTALEFLPKLLEKNNNNFNAVGREAASNPLVKNLVRNDPELAQMFFEKARERYGFENAQNLAAGFGLVMQNSPAQVVEDEGEDEGEDLENETTEAKG